MAYGNPAFEAMEYGYQLGDRIARSRERRTNNRLSRLVGGSLAEGDYTNAAARMFEAGQLEPGMAIAQMGQQQQQMSQEQMRAAAPAILNVTRQIRAMPPDQRAMMAPMMAQSLSEFGITPDMLDFDRLDDQTLDAEIAALSSLEAPAEPYTLGPGQIRYGAGNEVLARAPFKPDAASQPSPFTLSPGQQRFDAQGNLVASVDEQPEGPGVTDVVGEQNDLRSEYGKSVTQHIDILNSYARLVEAFNAGEDRDSAIGDQTISTMLARMADPNSVVRPSESEAVREAQALYQIWVTAPERFFTGSGRLHDRYRRQILDLAGQWNDVALRGIQARREEFEPVITDLQARGYDINPDAIFGVGTGEIAAEPRFQDRPTELHWSIDETEVADYGTDDASDRRVVRLNDGSTVWADTGEPYDAD